MPPDLKLDLTGLRLPPTEKTLGFAFEEFLNVHGRTPHRIVLTDEQADSLADRYHETISTYIKKREWKRVGRFRGVPIVTG